ncbi:hypothetical protein ZWY2020_048089 [Hordeum vulgare]|nr:hypothetical protein ZWY2020_048089 [Hordeum vulgare]
MEDTNKALADLTAAISAMSSHISEIHPIVLELQGWRPAINRLVDDLHAEVKELRQSIHAPRTVSASSPDPGLTKEKEAAPLICLADIPPLLPGVADISLPRPGEQFPAHGDEK